MYFGGIHSGQFDTAQKATSIWDSFVKMFEIAIRSSLNLYCNLHDGEVGGGYMGQLII